MHKKNPRTAHGLKNESCDSCANAVRQSFKTSVAHGFAIPLIRQLCKRRMSTLQNLHGMMVYHSQPNNLLMLSGCCPFPPPVGMESITPLVWMEPVLFSFARSHLGSLSGRCLFPRLPSAHGFAHGARGPAHGTRMKASPCMHRLEKRVLRS